MKVCEGERFHCSKEKAYKWITKDLPIYDFPERYRIIKPLKEVTDAEIPESVIFTVDPIQLTALMTLAGSIREGINDTVTPQGAACQMIGAYVFNEAQSHDPRAVLGMIDLAARKNNTPERVEPNPFTGFYPFNDSPLVPSMDRLGA